MTKLDKIKNQFYYTQDGRPDLNNYGIYRLGLLYEEIDDYLKVRAGKLDIKKLRKQFNQIAGRNTMGMAPDGRALMYRHDVERFADVLFEGKGTYFD